MLFQNSKLKIERAKKHISDLNFEINGFRKRNPYKFVIEQDPQSGNYALTFRVQEKEPYYLPLIIGDVIHNLRTALDILACELVQLNGGNADDVYFPFCDEGNYLDAMIEKRHINRAAPEVVQIIRSLKPYKGGNEALRAIHDLDIIDKHKTIIPCLGITDIPDLELFFNGESLVSFENCRVSAKDGMQIFNFPPAENIKIGDNFNASFDILFGYGQPFEGESITPSLHQFAELVNGIISTFTEHFTKTTVISTAKIII